MSLYDSGYKWALAALAEGGSISTVESVVDKGTQGDFDRGAAKALSDYVRMKLEEPYDTIT